MLFATCGGGSRAPKLGRGESEGLKCFVNIQGTWDSGVTYRAP